MHDNKRVMLCLKITSWVILKSVSGEYDVSRKMLEMLTEAGLILVKTDSKWYMHCRSGMSKLLHITRWLCLGMQNYVRKLL